MDSQPDNNVVLEEGVNPLTLQVDERYDALARTYDDNFSANWNDSMLALDEEQFPRNDGRNTRAEDVPAEADEIKEVQEDVEEVERLKGGERAGLFRAQDVERDEKKLMIDQVFVVDLKE
jgi:hypothetical protein